MPETVSDVLDLTRDIRRLAELAAHPAAVDELLGRALDVLGDIVPYDLAAVLELDGETLRVRTARGRLANEKVAHHHLDLAAFPTVRRALETRRARALTEQDHQGEEGDPYHGVIDLPDGHSCMVVPLYSGTRSLGAMTFDRTVCVPYADGVVELAGVIGQLVSLALVTAEQAALLDRYRRGLESERHRLEEAAHGDPQTREVLETSRSPQLGRVVALARQAAPTDVPVLLLGETGTGKEVLARALHRWSSRSRGPFVALNCAALPEHLVESELFGHVKGAFSGADRARDGRFVTANGGTLLLDEIGELPADAQAKLLRVLQEGTFEPVGSDRPVKVDVRILAATHVDLERAVAEKRFRQDLYYRLHVFPLTLPPLRDRLVDLEALVLGYLNDLHHRTGRGPWTVGPGVLHDLAARPWPGNIRELVNVLERATILSPPGPLRLEGSFGPAPGREAPPPAAAAAANGEGASTAVAFDSLAEHERRYIERVLEATGGKVYGDDGAAAILEVNPSTLMSRMKKLGVQRPDKARRSRA